MNRLLCILPLLGALVSPCVSKAESSMPANVILILADDLGWADTTLYGHTKLYETPNLERLAARGMTFTRAYANSPLCSPTRASILTGQTPARHGSTAPGHHQPQVQLEPTVQKSGKPGDKALGVNSVSRLDTSYPTLGKLLRKAGYATGHFGKWHLGSAPYSPLQHGFDVDVPRWHGPGPAGSFVAPWRYPELTPNAPTEHIEDRMAQEAVKWMNGLPGNRPFYLNYWQFSVHAPFDAKRERIEKYRGKIDRKDAQHSPTYAAMVESLDDAVGVLMDAVDEAGLADRTVFIFTSDNGGNMYNGIPETDKEGKPFVAAPTSNRPLRGGKATMYEGGIRVPTIVAWPEITKPGSRSDEIIQSSDFYPTLLHGLNVPLPEEHPIDGIDIAPALKGGRLKREAIFTYFPHAPSVPDWLPPSMAVHSGDWKLIRLFHEGENGAHAHRLYHLDDDPGETRNVASVHPDKARELDRLIDSHLREAGTVTPRPNPNFDPEQYQPDRIGVQLGGLRVAGKKARKAKNTQAIQGWRPGGTCTLSSGEGVLIVESSGGDPQMVLDARQNHANGPFTLTFRLKASAASGVNAFCNPPFRKGGFIGMGRVAAGQWHELSGRFEVEKLTGLRIDPLTSPGRADIDWIRLRDSDGKLVKAWDF